VALRQQQLSLNRVISLLSGICVVLSCAISAGCATAARPVHSKPGSDNLPAARKPLAQLRQKKIGFVEVFPLSTDSMRGRLPHQRCFTGELYTQKPKSPLSNSGLLFIPSDYVEIIGASFRQVLRDNQLAFEQYSSLETAADAGADILVSMSPMTFSVQHDTQLAQVEIYYHAAQPRTGKRIWDGQITSVRKTANLPRSVHSKTIIFMVGTHGFNFQPERALLAATTYANVVDLLLQLENVLSAP